MSTVPQVPAAQYVRASTDHQECLTKLAGQRTQALVDDQGPALDSWKMRLRKSPVALTASGLLNSRASMGISWWHSAAGQDVMRPS